MSIIRDLFTTRVNSTMMSMNERFTYLQKNAGPTQPNIVSIRAKNAAQQQASSKNRRLAMQMERRLTAMAALKIKKKSIRQRLGIPKGNLVRGSIRDRLSLPLRGRGRIGARGRGKRNQRGGLRRTQSRLSLQGGGLRRSRSTQSLNEAPLQRGRSRSRSQSRARGRTPSRGPTAGSVAGRSNSVTRQRFASAGPRRRFGPGASNRQQVGLIGRRKRLNSVGQGNRGKGNILNRGNGNARGRRALNSKRGGGNVGGRGRGQNRRRNSRPMAAEGRGRKGIPGRGRRGKGDARTPKTLPSKEELDQQLDRYMANTKSHLDRELDTYMKETNENDVW